MTATAIQDFLSAGRKVLQVATLGKDGAPHLAPMWFVMDEGKIVFRSFTKSQKIVNLARNPKLTVLVEDGDGYDELRGVMIKGTARFINERAYVLGVYGKLAAKYEMVGGIKQDLTPEDLETAFGRFAEKNTAVVVEPERIITWDHTKLGGAY